MARRLATIATALGAMVMPACIAVNTTEPLPITPPGWKPNMAGVLVPHPMGQGAPIPGDQFAEVRPNDVRPVESPKTGFAQTVATKPNGEIIQADNREVEPKKLPESVPSTPSESNPGPALTPPLAAPAKTEIKMPAIEPTPGPDGVIAPGWPTIKPVSGSVVVPIPLTMQPATPMAVPGNPLPTYPPNQINSEPSGPILTFPEPPQAKIAPPSLPSAIVEEKRPPVVPEVILGKAGPESEPTTTRKVKSSPVGEAIETPLIQAILAYQNNNPEAALTFLKTYDPTTQQILISLMPSLVRISEGKLAEMKPEEMDAILEEVTRIPNLLRTRASLQTNNVHLCREVTQFGHFKPFPARHAFRPGEMCYLYLELANFSCVPDAAANGFGIHLAGSIELRDGAGVLVWRADPKEVPDRVSSIPHDYYRAYRFEVPSVPSGQYSLQVRMVDKPTGRETKKSLAFAVTGK